MFRRIAILTLISLLAGTLAAQELDAARSAGSTYVPLDSWVYPAVERLAAEGVVDNAFLGLRPWTRAAVAQSLEAAQRRAATNSSADPQITSLLNSLRAEFAPELALETRGLEHRSMQLESIYTRSMYISGAPLADSFHFGQTIINDFGRPYQQGYNSTTGFTARAEDGHFAFYLSGEYDHAPGAPAYSLPVRQAIASADQTPLQPATPFAQQDSFRLLDSYASMTFFGQELSFGRQSLWWGPGEGGAMIFSDNAEPLTMLRLTRTLPMELPSVLHYLGPIRYDAFFGRLTGHQFPPSPFMHGEKFSFKPTPNLEFGFSRTAVFAGEGITPLTFSTLLHSYFSTSSSTGAGVTANQRNSPGARHGGFDFSYRLPFVRNWLTLYTDSLVHDDVSPIDAPRRAAINPGIYLSHFPHLHRLDLRAEAVNTDPPTGRSNGGKFFYWEQVYKDAYTNHGDLLGNWIGREGKGVQGWSTFWLSPQSSIQLGYRNAKVAKDFVPGGETANDFSLRARLQLGQHWSAESLVQYEQWTAPLLAPGRQSDVTGSLEIRFWPHKEWRSADHQLDPTGLDWKPVPVEEPKFAPTRE